MHDHLIECCSPEEIQRYLLNHSPADEKRRIEKHVLDCPFCADALEGFEFIVPSTDIIELTSHLNLNIDRRTAYIRRPVLFYLSIAASLIAILISTFYIAQLNQKKNEQVVVEVKIKDSIFPSSEPVLPEKNEVVLGSNIPQKNEKLKSQIISPEVLERGVDNAMAENDVLNEKTEVDNLFSTDAEPSTDTVDSEVFVQFDSEGDSKEENSSSALVAQDKVTVERSMESNMSEASRAMPEMARSLTSAKSSMKNNNDSDCFALFIKGDFQQALLLTDIQLENAEGEKRELLLMNKAKCLIALKDLVKSKSILKDLINFDGTQAQAARDLLKSIE